MLNQILIVNSNASERALLHSTLEEDFDVIEAENDDVAIEILREKYKLFSVIFLAIDDEPEEAVWEFLSKIRLGTYWRCIPVIGTTKQPDKRLVETAMVNGANVVFASPYDKSILIPYLANLIDLCKSVASSNTQHREELNETSNYETFLLEGEKNEHELGERIKAIMDNAKCGITAVAVQEDGSIDYIFINDRFYEMLGYTREEFRSEVGNPFDLIIPQDYVKIVSETRMLYQVGQSSVLNMRVRRRDGIVIWLRCDITVIEIDDIENPVQLSSFTDITPEKEAEEQLRFLNESAHEILAQPDSEKGIEGTLKRILKYFGGEYAYVAEFNYANKMVTYTYEVCGKYENRTNTSEQKKTFEESDLWYKSLLKKEYVIVGDNEKMLAALWRDGKLIGYVGIEKPFMRLNKPDRLMALTDYIAVLITRRDLVRQVRALLDNLPCGAALYEFDGTNIYGIHLNKRYWELVNREPIEYNGRSVTDAVHPDDRIIIFQEISAAIRQNREARCDIRVNSGDGIYCPLHVAAKIMPKDEKTYSLFVSYTPIDDESMSFQEMLPIALSAMMSASDDMVYVKDVNSTYICGSQSMANILGYHNAREIIGKNDYDFFDRETADAFVKDDRDIIYGTKSVINREEEIPDETGNIHYANTSKFPLWDSNGNIVGLYGVSHDVTRILETESQLKFLADSISGGLASFELYKKNVKPLFLNEAFYSMSGYSREEYLTLTKKDPFAMLFREDKPKLRAIIKAVTDDNTEEHMGELTYRRRTKNNDFRWMNLKCTASKLGKDRHIVNIVQVDITEQKKIEEELRYREEEYRYATMHSGNAICRYNIAKQTLLITSETAIRLSLSECVEGVPYERVREGLVSEDTSEAYIAFYESIINGIKENRVRFKKLQNGEWRWINAYASTIFNNSGKPVSAIISFSDVTEQFEKELQSKVLAETDSLTGLLNRKAFQQKFETMLEGKNEDDRTALYMIDVDKFKFINDQFGHIAGDRALAELAQKMREIFRSEDLIARFGGDEFIACISGTLDKEIIEGRARQMCESVRDSKEIDGGITISLGIAVAPDNGDTFEELYEKADSALYQVKEHGKNHFCFYDDIS